MTIQSRSVRFEIGERYVKDAILRLQARPLRLRLAPR
jgi:hypothetical protein